MEVLEGSMEEMVYFKNPENGEVYAYAKDGSQDHDIKSGLVRMTDEEVVEYFTPVPPTIEQLKQIATSKRDELLVIAAIRIAPLQDAADLGKATPAKTALLKKWKEYRIDLDDISEQSEFPSNIAWPVEPS